MPRTHSVRLNRDLTLSDLMLKRSLSRSLERPAFSVRLHAAYIQTQLCRVATLRGTSLPPGWSSMWRVGGSLTQREPPQNTP